MGIPEGGEREKRTEEIFEVKMAEIFPKLLPDTKPQIQEAQRAPSRIKPKNLHPGISYSNQRKTKTKRKS